MAPKKQSTSYNQRSRRPSRMKESVSSSVSLEDVDPLQSSTPKQDRTRSTVKLTKKEISKAAEELTAEMQNQIDEYVKSTNLFKLSLERQLLKSPLWQSEEYRENYAVDVIKIDENVENVEPMCSSRRLRTSSVDRFKKPAPVATKAAEELTAEMQNQIDEYVKSTNLFKLSLERQLLKSPLWQSEEYRENYAVDVIKIDENVENVEPMCSSRRLRTSSVDRFKKPAPVATKAAEELTAEMQNQIDEYVKSTNLFKLSLERQLLKSPLWQSEEYRENYAVDVIKIDENVENVEPMCSSRRLRTSSVDRFKKPAPVATKAAEELTAEMQNQIDEYVKSTNLFKLSLERQLLKSPLWQSEEYRENYAVDVIKIDENVENVEPMCSSRRLRTSSVDRFKKPAPVAIKQTGGRVSRSATRSRNSAMKIPYMSSQFGSAEMTPITPKFDINTPVSVLRQPRLGEQVVSLSGSPLHVAIPTATNPTINVPLSDGNVVTIHPRYSQSNRPHAPPVALDPECRHKLQTIQMYLTHMLSGYNSE